MRQAWPCCWLSFQACAQRGIQPGCPAFQTPHPVPSAQKSGYSQAKQDLHSRGPVRAHAAQGCASLWLPFARLVLPGCRLVSLGQLCVCALCGTVYHTAEKVGVAWKEHYFWKGSQTITKL